MQKLWIHPPEVDPFAVQTLAGDLRIAPLVAEILVRRGLHEPLVADEFLRPRLKKLSDPFELPDMQAGITRLLHALDTNQAIGIYGDYDVDGVTSLTILTRVLRKFGARITCFLPHRMEEGYGLNPESLERCMAEMKPQLLICVDCGTSSAEEIRQIRAHGVDVIVIDHHEVPEITPDCTALINPKRNGVHDYLCTAGLVFKFCHALLKQRRNAEVDLRDYLDLAALGTVADIAPLKGENRILVQAGLRRIAASRWPGVRALIEITGVEAPVTVKDLGFRLGPRLNAAGRLGTAQVALDLLLCDDENDARRLAAELDVQNRARQDVETDLFGEALRQAEEQAARGFPYTLVIGGDGWHKGVLGIVAARLMHHFHRPVFVIGFSEDGLGKGSGRSPGTLKMVDALTACSGLLENFGGHAAAAGLTIRRENLEEFRKAFEMAARRHMTPACLKPRLQLDAEVFMEDLHAPLLEEYGFLEPFGSGNPQPVLWVRNVPVLSEPRIMKEKHMRVQLGTPGGSVAAIFFNAPVDNLPPPPWDVAFWLEANHYRGHTNLQMTLQDIREAQ